MQGDKTLSAFDFAEALARRTGLAIGECAFAIAMRAGGPDHLFGGDLVESSHDATSTMTRLETYKRGRSRHRGGTSIRVGPLVEIHGTFSGSAYFASVAVSVNKNMPWPLPSLIACTAASMD